MSEVDAKNMSPSQRVLAMEALWESMCGESDEPESPGWHEELLGERRERIARGEGRFVTLEQLRESLGR